MCGKDKMIEMHLCHEGMWQRYAVATTTARLLCFWGKIRDGLWSEFSFNCTLENVNVLIRMAEEHEIL